MVQLKCFEISGSKHKDSHTCCFGLFFLCQIISMLWVICVRIDFLGLILFVFSFQVVFGCAGEKEQTPTKNTEKMSVLHEVKCDTWPATCPVQAMCETVYEIVKEAHV